MRKFRLGIVSIVFLSASALATTFYERPFPASVQDATGIVRGRVGMTYSDWGFGSDSTKRLYTFIELQLTETFKGEAKGSSIVLRELGGAKDGVAMEVAGTAHFVRGEDVVVMIGAPNPDGSYDVRGLMMAKYNVEREADGKEYLHGPGLSGGEHVYKDAKREGQLDVQPGQNAPRSPQKRWTVDGLRELVRDQERAGNIVSNQRGGNGTPQSLKQNPAPSPSASSPQPPVFSDPAPPLQSADAEDDGRGGLKSFLLLGIGIIVGVGLYLLKKFRARR